MIICAIMQVFLTNRYHIKFNSGMMHIDGSNIGIFPHLNPLIFFRIPIS